MSKSKFSDCDNCPLLQQQMVFGETNCEDDLKKVELLVLAEAPASDEVEQGRPLVGPAGKIFREVFEQNKLNEVPYFITNVVLCSNLYKDKKTGNIKTDNPPDKAIESCKPNWQKLVEMLEPSLILIMGDIPKKVFEIPGLITKERGKLFEYKFPLKQFIPPEVLLTIHPSYVRRGGGLKSDRGKEFKDDFKKALSILNPVEYEKLIKEEEKSDTTIFQRQTLNLKSPYFFELPTWMKNEKHSLIDIQKLPSSNTLIFSFRDKNGEKKFHTIKNSEYYFYQKEEKHVDSNYLERVENLEFIKGNNFNFEKNPNITKYESDVNLEIKYSIDYYLQRTEEEPNVPLKVQFFDIEVYNEGNKAFPNPKDAKRPINAISFKYNEDEINVYVVNPEKLVTTENFIKNLDVNTDKWKVTVFDSEKKMIESYIKNTAENKPDIITAWNIWFDLLFIYCRSKRLGIDINKWSPLNFVHVNPHKYGDILIAGFYALDMLQLYKDFTASVKPSYKLGAIAKEELKDETKIEFEGSLDELYETDFPKFIDYSGQDTNLLYEINKAMGHIDLRNEMRKICCTTWQKAESTMGLIDPLVIANAKKRNLICKDASKFEDLDSKFKGAYVRNPKRGLHGWLIDLDFASLYPSIIISCNIGPDTYIGKIDEDIAFNFIYYNKTLPDEFEINKNPIRESSKKEKIKPDDFKKWIEENQAIVTCVGSIYKGHNLKLSFFNIILSELLDRRKNYKDEMKVYEGQEGQEELYKVFYCRQWAYKILANSIYGVLGNRAFRMFKLDLAEAVTYTGREVTKFLGHHVSRFMDENYVEIDPKFKENYEDDKPYLVYQDTDSVFLQIGDYLVDKEKISLENLY